MIDNRNAHHPTHPRHSVEYNRGYLLKGYVIRIFNSSVSTFAEHANSQHGSAISNDRTSASSTKTEGTASTNSPSSFCVEDAATSVGRADIINRFWSNAETHTILKTHFSHSVTTHRTWSTWLQNVNGITQHFKSSVIVMHPRNYPKNGFPKLETPGAVNSFHIFLTTPYSEKNYDQSVRLTMTLNK